MKKFYEHVVKHRKLLMVIFIIVAVICAFLQPMISVDYDLNDYLPEDTPSTVSINKNSELFKGHIPNGRVMLKNVTVKQALNYKKRMKKVKGVIDVTWIDDYIPLQSIPIQMIPNKYLKNYYKDHTALMTPTIDEAHADQTVAGIRKIIGNKNAITGAAVSQAIAMHNTITEIRTISIFAVIFIFLVLLITTTSWIEPLIVLLGLGIAILINGGSNLIFGTISFVTNAAGSILQLAVSLDYSVFLIHTFETFRKQPDLDPNEAMVHALVSSTSSILSSGLTTVIGFLALVFMRFRIGPDMGLALAKGVAISLITVFLFMPGVILGTYPVLEKTSHRSLLPSFKKFGRFVYHVMIPCCIALAIFVVPAYLASTHNSYYYGSSHIFSSKTQYGKDTAAVEKVFGKHDNYVLIIPNNDELKERELAEEINDMKGVSSVIDLAEITGPALPVEVVPYTLRHQLDANGYRRMVINVNVNFEGKETFALVKKIRKAASKSFGTYYLAGEGVSTYDLMDTITNDMGKVNGIAIGAVFLVLLATMRNFLLPFALVITIESAIWVNFAIATVTHTPIFYIAYLIVSSIQLGATVDYAIYMTENYRVMREREGKKEAIVNDVSYSLPSLLTSGTVLTVVPLMMGIISTHGVLKEIGHYLGIGTILSLLFVTLVLPGLLYMTDRLIIRKNKTA